MTYETLQYVDGSGATQEVAMQNLCANGAAVRLVLEPRSHAAGEFHITLPQPPETPIAIPFKSRCNIRACRASSSGANNTFSAGTIIFQGRRTDNSASAGHNISTQITLSDALWDLEQLTYKVGWQYISGGTYASPTYSNFFWPDIVMFQADQLGQLQPGGTYAAYSPAPVQGLISTWQQIMAIVFYAANYATGAEAVQLQMGTTAEFTPNYRNSYGIRSVKCLQCLTTALQSHPGVYTEMDYTTTPPTLHFRDRTTMTAVTLPYASTDVNGVLHLASDVQSLVHLVPGRIAIYYQINGTFTGRPVILYGDDIYPASGGPFLMTQDYSVDISGADTSQTTKNFTSSAFDPTSLALWRNKVPSLKQLSQNGQIPNDGSAGALLLVDSNPYNATTHPKGLQVVDETNTPINYSSGNFQFITDDSVYAWFTLTGGAAAQAVRATVKGYFKYQKQNVLGGVNLTDEKTEHEHSFRCMLTTAPSGQYVLNQTLSAGESIPANLAQAIYTELQSLQYKLRHEIWQLGANSTTVPTLIKPGKHMINLSGGLSAWTTINAVPQNVSIEFMRTADGRLGARQTINCGPVNHLEPGYLIQLYNLFAQRNLRRINAQQKLTGIPSSQVDLSTTDSKENTVAADSVKKTEYAVLVDGSGNFTALKNSATDVANGLALT